MSEMRKEQEGSGWKKLDPIGPVRSGCLNCPPKPEAAPMDWDPHPGFGGVDLTRNGERVVSYFLTIHDEGDDAAAMTVQDFEDRAAGDPDHDWRFKINGPLSEVTYQRHGDSEWYAVEKGMGFA
jgi:hypothetical protein